MLSRFMQMFLTSGLLITSCLSHKIYDDAEHSGDFEPGTSTLHTSKHAPKNVAEISTKAVSTTSRKSNLQSDLNDFLELIPTDEIKEKLDEYYRNDDDVRHIYEYLSSKEFYELGKHLLEMQHVKEVLQYFNRKGFNIKSLVRKVCHRLGIFKNKPLRQSNPSDNFSLGTNTTIGGVNGLLEDILSLLPQDEIFVLFFEKLEKSPQFNTLVAAIGNPDFARKYNILWNSKEFHSASSQLKKHKIDVGKIIQILQNYFFFGSL